MKPIRNLSFLSVMIVVLTLMSCGKDIEGENKANLLGSWAAIERSVEDCDDPNGNLNLTLECTESDCIRYFFSDSTNQAYIQEVTVNGVTESEAGTFSVGENTITFCSENDGEETCVKSDLHISKTLLIITTSDETTGCSEAIKFKKEEEE